MTSRDLVVRTLNRQPVDRVPRNLEVSACIERFREDELEEMNFCYPSDIQEPDFNYPRGRRAKGTPGKAGRYTDAWGCIWQIAKQAAEGHIVGHPLADPARIAAYRPPLELLEKLTPAQIRRASEPTTRFLLAPTQTRLLERLWALRGPEAATADLESGNHPIRELLAALHDFSCQEVTRWAATDVDGVSFQDTFGAPGGPPIETQLWRDLFKPLYRQYCQVLHENDKFVFFRSTGDASGVFNDLLEIGVDAVDCPWSLMDLEDLAQQYRGRITFWAEVEPEVLRDSGSVENCRGAVRHLRKNLDDGQGGLIAVCRWDAEMPFENVATVLEEWRQPVPTCF